MQKMRSDAEKIYTQAIQASLPDEAVKKAVAGRNFAFQGKVVIIAVGKAAWNMAKAAAEPPPPSVCWAVWAAWAPGRR